MSSGRSAGQGWVHGCVEERNPLIHLRKKTCLKLARNSSEFELSMSAFEFSMSDFESSMSDVESSMSDFKSNMPDIYMWNAIMPQSGPG